MGVLSSDNEKTKAGDSRECACEVVVETVKISCIMILYAGNMPGRAFIGWLKIKGGEDG
jgi:hypothetical protein